MSEARGWELVGGPECGEVVATGNDYPLWRILKPPPCYIIPPTEVEDILAMLPTFGVYRAVSMRDRRERVMRWQGWER